MTRSVRDGHGLMHKQMWVEKVPSAASNHTVAVHAIIIDARILTALNTTVHAIAYTIAQKKKSPTPHAYTPSRP